MPVKFSVTGVSEAHMAVARLYSSPFLLGPPVDTRLTDLVRHMFTEEEAELVRHLKPWRVKPAEKLAAAAGMTAERADALLDSVARQKYVIGSFGESGRERYVMLPIVPGTFEMALIRRSPESVTEWHRRFAELYEELFATGYATQYFRGPVDFVRYLPVGESIEGNPMALPSDSLEEVFSRYRHFAVGVCQCRLSRNLTGEGCGRMLETCTIMGDLAPTMASQGRMKQASLKDVLEIKRASEKEGLVTWLMNEESGRYSNTSCSCCGCCCGALRSISEFNAPGIIAPPHFMPRIDGTRCAACGECVAVCPMGALEVSANGDGGILIHKTERCIGCGLCVLACADSALTMREVGGYREPPAGWPQYLAKKTHVYLRNMLGVWFSRRWNGRMSDIR